MDSRLQLPKTKSQPRRSAYRSPLPPFSTYTRDGGMRRGLKSLAMLLIALVVLALALYLFRVPLLQATGGALVHDPEPAQSDVIVVLGGGGLLRAEKAVELYRQGFAPEILVMLPLEVSDQTPYGDHIEMEARMIDALFRFYSIPQEDVNWLGRPVFSTYQEAVHLRDWMNEAGARSALVVAGYFQSSRAQWSLDRVFDDSDIRAQVIAAHEPEYDKSDWWRHLDGLLQVQNEYVKFLFYRLQALRGDY